jgi:hypothetical protein
LLVCPRARKATIIYRFHFSYEGHQMVNDLEDFVGKGEFKIVTTTIAISMLLRIYRVVKSAIQENLT